MIRQVAVQPSFNENEFEEAKKKREVLAGMVVKDFQDAYARRMASIRRLPIRLSRTCTKRTPLSTRISTFRCPTDVVVFNVPVDLKKLMTAGEGKEVFSISAR